MKRDNIFMVSLGWKFLGWIANIPKIMKLIKVYLMPLKSSILFCYLLFGNSFHSVYFIFNLATTKQPKIKATFNFKLNILFFCVYVCMYVYIARYICTIRIFTTRIMDILPLSKCPQIISNYIELTFPRLNTRSYLNLAMES